MFDPWQMFIWPPIPAFLVAIGYLVYSHWAASNRQDNIDHRAHLWGAAFGLIFILITGVDMFIYEHIKTFLGYKTSGILKNKCHFLAIFSWGFIAPLGFIVKYTYDFFRAFTNLD